MFKFRKKKENKVQTPVNNKIIITNNDIERILEKFNELERYNWDGSPIEVTFSYGYSSMVFNGFPIYTKD